MSSELQDGSAPQPAGGTSGAPARVVSESVPLREDELAAVCQPKGWGIVKTLGCGILSPVLWFFLLWATFGNSIDLVRWRRAKPSYLAYARRPFIGLEPIALLLVIPLSAVLVTIGTGITFYLWSRPGNTHRQTGWNVLIPSVGLAVFLPIFLFRMIARHRSGADPLPFDPTVDPKLGVEICRKRRRDRPAGFLPSGVRFAIAETERMLEGKRDPTAPTVGDVVVHIMRGGRDRIQLAVIALLGSASVAAVEIATGKRWWVVAIGVVASFALIVVSATQAGLTAWYQRVRWAVREDDLGVVLARQQSDEDYRRAVESLAHSIPLLIEAMRARPKSHLREWLSNRR